MITTKIINEWVDLYVNKKLSGIQIAKKYNCTKSTVYTYLHLRGIKTPRYRTYNPSSPFFLGKYIICIYDLEEHLVWEFDNPREMAETLNKPLKSIKSHLTDKRIHRKFRHKGKWYRIHLVEVDENDV